MIGNFWLHHVASSLVAIIFMAFFRAFGDYGTGDQDLTDVVLHSTVLVLCAYPFQSLFAVSFMRADWTWLPPRQAATLGCVLAAIPISFVAPVASWLIGVLPRELPLDAGRDLFLQDLAARYPFVLFGFAIVGTVMWMVLNFAWWRRRLGLAGNVPEPSLAASDGEHPAVPETVLLSKLPHDRRGRILALCAERHYVRVITDRGEDLVLMRFADAVAVCDALDGIQVHRSHWVSRSAVRNVRRRAGRVEVELSSGHEFPVSRSYQGRVRDLIPQV